MYRSSPFRSTLNTGYIKLWTCVALDQCKSWTPFGHFCPYFHTPYTLLCPKDEFTFTFRRGLIWKIDNPSTTLSLAPGIFDNPYKGAESAGCQKHQSICSNPRSWPVDRNVEPLSQIVTSWVAQLLICSGRPTRNRCLVLTNWMELILWRDISSCTWSRMPR